MWGYFAFLMGLKHVNATPSSRKTPFVDINRPICEECRKANFLLKKLTWGNAGRNASERFPSVLVELANAKLSRIRCV